METRTFLFILRKQLRFEPQGIQEWKQNAHKVIHSFLSCFLTSWFPANLLWKSRDNFLSIYTFKSIQGCDILSTALEFMGFNPSENILNFLMLKIPYNWKQLVGTSLVYLLSFIICSLLLIFYPFVGRTPVQRPRIWIGSWNGVLWWLS